MTLKLSCVLCFDAFAACENYPLFILAVRTVPINVKAINVRHILCEKMGRATEAFDKIKVCHPS